MVSGFLTSPCDHSRIFSGDASEMRIALKESGSLGFSKKLKMSRIGFFLFPGYCGDETLKTLGGEEDSQGEEERRSFFFPPSLLVSLFHSHSSAACSLRCKAL